MSDNNEPMGKQNVEAELEKLMQQSGSRMEQCLAAMQQVCVLL